MVEDPYGGQCLILETYRHYGIALGGSPGKYRIGDVKFLNVIVYHFSVKNFDWKDCTRDLLKQCYDQWVSDGEEYQTCLACACSQGLDSEGHEFNNSTIIRYNYYVENRLNGNVLRVGSVCISKHWSDTVMCSSIRETKLAHANAAKGKLLCQNSSCTSHRKWFVPKKDGQEWCNKCMKESRFTPVYQTPFPPLPKFPPISDPSFELLFSRPLPPPRKVCSECGFSMLLREGEEWKTMCDSCHRKKSTTVVLQPFDYDKWVNEIISSFTAVLVCNKCNKTNRWDMTKHLGGYTCGCGTWLDEPELPDSLKSIRIAISMAGDMYFKR